MSRFLPTRSRCRSVSAFRLSDPAIYGFVCGILSASITMPPAREHSHAPCAQQTWKCLPVRAHGRGILRANIAAAPVRKYAGSIKTRSISRRADCRKSEKRHKITVCTNFTFFLTLSLTPGCVQYITGKKFFANHFSYSSYELLDQPGADIDGE